MNKTFIHILFTVFSVCNITAQNSNYVNVFIGTDGTGHTFPGPSMPFGMVQPGMDNKDKGWVYTSGYQYNDNYIMGFSQNRFNGTGINEMGDVLLFPFVNDNVSAHTYQKKNETGKVGYYSVIKDDLVKVELTCSNRVAYHRYTFPVKNGKILVNLQHGLKFVFDENNAEGLVVDSNVKIENNYSLSGYCSTKNWINRKYFFTIVFDKPFIKQTEPSILKAEKAPKYIFEFEDSVVQVKIALSTVSVAGAKLNLQTEIPDWKFDNVYQHNLKTWDNYLNKIDISASQKQKEIFYTSLYHLLLQPSNIADVDGKYRGVDDKIAIAANKEYYSTLSIWDIYRAAFPLLQIIAPEKINGIINSMLAHYKAKGFLPIWTAWGQDNYCMIGNHAIPMILSAYNNGFRGFDKKTALDAMVVSSTKSHINSDWSLYNHYGYYPFDYLDNESVSRTLESGVDDWCVAQMADCLNDTINKRIFNKRALYYKNLYDPETKLFRGKDSHGSWRAPFDPLKATSPLNNPGDYTEANAWQYFWTPAQYDIEGMISLLKGKKAFTQQLDQFFTTEAQNPDKFLGQEAMIGQYAHGNEPSHHIAYLYAYSLTPKTGQKYIHQIINEFHNNTPNGMIGNDDCGQMSAWYIFSCLGFYPVNAANGTFVYGSPQVEMATIYTGKRKFIVKAKNYSTKNIYNSERLINGNKTTRPFIRYCDILKGGVLEFNMTEN